jgi:DNA-binding CsgD family transcriptional regulator
MEQCEGLSTLIGNIYDSAIDRPLWVSVLAKCAQFIVGSGAALLVEDAAGETRNAKYYCGIDPYFAELHGFDVLAVERGLAEIGEPISIADVMPYERFLATRPSWEWPKSQGIVDALIVALDKTTTSATYLVIFRHERHGRVNDEARKRMRLIAPHVRRSVLIGKLIDLSTAEATMFADALNCIKDGLLFVDAQGRIVHANVSGHALVSEGSLLRSDGQRPAFADPTADRLWYDLVQMAARGDDAFGAQGIALAVAESRCGERYVAHALPLTSAARRRGVVSHAAVAALFVHRAVLDAPSPSKILAKAYRLTPTELRVLLAIVQVGGIPETAVAMGVAETTVKTHLRRLFDKTGASRQADLASLSLASPIHWFSSRRILEKRP